MMDADRRARLAAAKAMVNELQKPETEERRQKRRDYRKAMSKALGRDKGQRQPQVKDKPYLAFLRRQPCCVGPLLKDGCAGRIDPAHIRFTDRSVGRVNPGLGAKSDDRWCLSVCRKHHDAQHAYGNEAKWWSVVVRANPNELAAAAYAVFEGQQ